VGMRIAIVSGNPLAVEILRQVVTSLSRHQVAWIASNGAEAVKRAAGEKPDLVLMDLFLPGMGDPDDHEGASMRRSDSDRRDLRECGKGV